MKLQIMSDLHFEMHASPSPLASRRRRAVLLGQEVAPRGHSRVATESATTMIGALRSVDVVPAWMT